MISNHLAKRNSAHMLATPAGPRALRRPRGERPQHAALRVAARERGRREAREWGGRGPPPSPRGAARGGLAHPASLVTSE